MKPFFFFFFFGAVIKEEENGRGPCIKACKEIKMRQIACRRKKERKSKGRTH